MKEDLKEKFLETGSSFYDKEWIEKAADAGFDDFIKIFNSSVDNPKYHLSRDSDFRFALLYYSAFEHALNVMLHQVLEDAITDIDLCLNELNRVTASIRRKEVSND